MPFKIEITGNTKEELVDAVNELSTIMVLPTWKPEPAQPKQEAKPEPTVAKPEPKVDKPKAEPKPEPKVEKPEPAKVTKNDIKKALIPILQEKRDAIQEAFESFGVSKLSELAEADYAAFLEKVQAM